MNRVSGLAVVRVVVSILLGVHGVTRALEGSVHGLGDFLASQGIPFGHALAIGITSFEIVGSLLMMIGLWVRFIAPVHAAVLLAGIVMVHAKNGWFVVGRGTGGVEYSVLLIGCLLGLTLESWRARGNAPSVAYDVRSVSRSV